MLRKETKQILKDIKKGNYQGFVTGLVTKDDKIKLNIHSSLISEMKITIALNSSLKQDFEKNGLGKESAESLLKDILNDTPSLD